MIAVRHWVAAFAAVAVLGSGLSAQAGKGKDAKAEPIACALDFENPSELKDAQSQLAFSQMGKGDAQKKALAKAVEKLSRRADYYTANSVAHAFLLGEALVLWSEVPGEAGTVRRGDLGFLGEKDQQIDLLKTADSLFTVVEKAEPSCNDQTTVYRRSAWARFINRVGPLINADKLDSATAVLGQSMVIYRDSPYTTYFLGQIAYRKDEFAKAADYFEQSATKGAIDVATDSTIAGIVEYSTFFAGYSKAHAAALLSGADQTTAYKKAATLYSAYLKNYHCGSFAENAANGLTDALRSDNDTAGLRVALTNMTQEQKPCSDLWWYNAARDASEADMNELAVTLSDKAVSYSPYSAALGNAGGALFKAKAWPKLLPVARRLTELAPNSVDNWEMLALAYQGLSEKAPTPAIKKAYSDSLTQAYNQSVKIVVKVRVTEYTSDGPKRAVGGTIELVNNDPDAQPVVKPKGKGGKPAAAAPASASAKLKPRPVTIKIEFLDRAGAVVAVKDSAGAMVNSLSQTVTASGEEKAQFRVATLDPKIVGYRYAPIP